MFSMLIQRSAVQLSISMAAAALQIGLSISVLSLLEMRRHGCSWHVWCYGADCADLRQCTLPVPAASLAPAAISIPPAPHDQTHASEHTHTHTHTHARTHGIPLQLLLLLFSSRTADLHMPPLLWSLQPPDKPSAMVVNSLRSSLASSKGTKHGAVLGSFLADTLSPLPAAAALLQYNLPATFEVMPLLVRITGGFVEHKNGAAVALVTVQWHVPREVKQQPAGEGVAGSCWMLILLLDRGSHPAWVVNALVQIQLVRGSCHRLTMLQQ